MCIKRRCLRCKQAPTCMKARPSTDFRLSMLTSLAWHSCDKSLTSCSCQVPAEKSYVAYASACRTWIQSRYTNVSTAPRVTHSTLGEGGQHSPRSCPRSARTLQYVPSAFITANRYETSCVQTGLVGTSSEEKSLKK